MIHNSVSSSLFTVVHNNGGEPEVHNAMVHNMTECKMFRAMNHYFKGGKIGYNAWV